MDIGLHCADLIVGTPHNGIFHPTVEASYRLGMVGVVNVIIKGDVKGIFFFFAFNVGSEEIEKCAC